MTTEETAQTTGGKVASNIRRFRLERNLSVAALAKASYISPDALKRMEFGERKVSVDELSLLAGGLGVSELSLLDITSTATSTADALGPEGWAALRSWLSAREADEGRLSSGDLAALGRIVGIGPGSWADLTRWVTDDQSEPDAVLTSQELAVLGRVIGIAALEAVLQLRQHGPSAESGSAA